MENNSWVMPTHIIAAAGIVLNEKEEVLMVKANDAGWVFPGGQVEVGENVINAVKREIMEEAGIEAVYQDHQRKIRSQRLCRKKKY